MLEAQAPTFSYRISAMMRKRRQHERNRRPAWFSFAVGLALLLVSPAAAQDVRGLEVCTAEKQMERRTGCLQANVEFLQQALARLARETQEKIAAAGRDLAAARAEIAALKSTLDRLNNELAQMKAKVEPANKK